MVSPLCWLCFSSWLLQFHFDSSLFIYKHGHDTTYLLLYVDDIILTASSTKLLVCFMSSLRNEFAMSDLGSIKHFLGISVTFTSQGIFLYQKQYTKDILARSNMSNCNPCHMPINTHSKLSTTCGPPVANPTHYRSLAEVLQYLTFTHLDIAYADNLACSCMILVNHISIWLSASWGTFKVLLIMDSSSTKPPVQTLLPTQMPIGPSVLTHASCVANIVAESCWLCQLLLELHRSPSKVIVVYRDNVNAMYLSSNPVQHQRT